ncbi:hypothetical protein AB4212_28630 [Streptomyces sp. 2MCAF27]
MQSGGQLERARRRSSIGPLLTLSDAIARGHGRVDDGALQAARDAGASDAEIGEVVGHLALNVLTNYFNILAKVDNDWPVVTPRSAV